LIAGAAAKVAGERTPDVVLGDWFVRAFVLELE
jgi:hypothetical protein